MLKENLSMQHQSVWNTLRTMEDGERIIGADLRELAGIPEERYFYKIIEDLRAAGILIGASRNEPKGYYEIRTDHDMKKWLKNKRDELYGELKALDDQERYWFLGQYVSVEEEDDEDDGTEKAV